MDSKVEEGTMTYKLRLSHAFSGVTNRFVRVSMSVDKCFTVVCVRCAVFLPFDQHPRSPVRRAFLLRLIECVPTTEIIMRSSSSDPADQQGKAATPASTADQPGILSRLFSFGRSNSRKEGRRVRLNSFRLNKPEEKEGEGEASSEGTTPTSQKKNKRGSMGDFYGAPEPALSPKPGTATSSSTPF